MKDRWNGRIRQNGMDCSAWNEKWNVKDRWNGKNRQNGTDLRLFHRRPDQGQLELQEAKKERMY